MRSTEPLLSEPSAVCWFDHCPEIATIEVASESDATRPLCAGHWHQLRATTPDPMRVIAVLARPTCFRLDCEQGAVELLEHLDGSTLPVCSTHLEDLSWVTPDATELTNCRSRA